jgi:hypothetical protein
MKDLIGWFMIATGFALFVLFATIAMGDDDDN